MTGRGSTLLSRLSIVGDLLVLQLMFLGLSLGVVTLVPAAFALQRVLPEAMSQEYTALPRRFWRQFTWALRRFWLAGLGLCLGAVALVTALLFWAAAGGPVRIVALAVLIPLGGMAIGLYLSALAALPDVDEDVTPRTLLRAATGVLQRRPLAVAGAVIALVTWLLLLMRVPTLVLVGSGLVPALLAHVITSAARRT